MTGRMIMTFAAAAAVFVPPAAAQDITLGGQIRPRYEFRDPVAGEGDAFTSMRVRAQLSAALDRNVRVFIQVQDVRLWGEETNTLGDFAADGFDLHQGYLEIRRPGAVTLSARVGRQETSFGGQRLVGAVGWAQQGRAFDGVRLGARGTFGTVELVGFKLSEGSDPDVALDAEFAGVYASLAGIPGGTLDVYGLYDRVASGTGTSRGTVGARFHRQGNPFTYRIEGAYQFGKEQLVDVGAFMVGARVGANLGRGSVTLWYDYLSGDDAPTDGKTSVFNTLFATNHKFYGFADLFIDIPAHTRGFGLQDIALKTAVTATDRATVMLDVHHFRAASTGTLTSARFGEDTENLLWIYVMLDARF